MDFSEFDEWTFDGSYLHLRNVVQMQRKDIILGANNDRRRKMDRLQIVERKTSWLSSKLSFHSRKIMLARIMISYCTISQCVYSDIYIVHDYIYMPVSMYTYERIRSYLTIRVYSSYHYYV